MDDFTLGYVHCALWLADNHPGHGPWSPHGKYTVEHILPYQLHQMIEHCRMFQEVNKATLQLAYEIGYTPAQAGLDFWLTRNGHGAGYWDGDLPEDIGETLTSAAHIYGEFDLQQP